MRFIYSGFWKDKRTRSPLASPRSGPECGAGVECGAGRCPRFPRHNALQDSSSSAWFVRKPGRFLGGIPESAVTIFRGGLVAFLFFILPFAWIVFSPFYPSSFFFCFLCKGKFRAPNLRSAIYHP